MRWFSCLWLGLVSLGFGGSLTFPEKLKELKAAADVTELVVDFPFTNQTDKPIEIKKFDAECSCMSAGVSGGKLRYEPGESGVIRGKFDMANFFGTVEKQISVWVEDDRENAPSIRLTVKVEIPEVVKLEPKTLSWTIGEEGKPKTVTVTVEGSEPVHVKSVTNSNAAFRHELKTLEDGKRYEVVITPADTNVAALGIFKITTDCALVRHREKQAYATVRRPSPEKPAAAKQ